MSATDTQQSKRPKWKDLPGGSAAGVFGPEDELGTLNLLTPERTAAAAGLIRNGQTFSLNASILDYNNPTFFARSKRRPPKHTVLELNYMQSDDFLDGFYPQLGTQWDHFLHCGDSETGRFYNDMDPDASRALQVWAERGIVGRGVLLDVARWAEDNGNGFGWIDPRAITAQELVDCAADQGVTVDEGTILLVRVGWQSGYEALSPQERIELPLKVAEEPGRGCAGLQASPDMSELLWDWGIAAIACDNPALESMPFASRLLHEDVLGRLGIPVGEFWLLDALAEACRAEGRYEFFVTSAPLNVPRGRGSTANALAVM
jgi:hypothetical protein